MKKLAALLIATLLAVTLCGCGAEINYYYSVEGDEYKYEYTVALSNELVNELESTAATTATGTRWTFSAYMSGLANAFGYDYYYGEGDGQKLYSLSRTVNADDLPERDESEEDDTKVEVKAHFFTREYVYTTAHPLASQAGEYASGSFEPGSLYYILDNGALLNGGGVIYPIRLLFPALGEKSVSDLKLSFYWKTDELDTPDGEKVKINGETYLKWTMNYDEQDKTVSYVYYGVNPLGWYIVILGVSVIAVAVVVIVAKKKGGEGKLVEPNAKRQHRYEDESVVYSESNFERFGTAQNARSVDIFASAEKEEDERIKKRIDELFSPEEAAEIKRRMDEKKK